MSVSSQKFYGGLSRAGIPVYEISYRPSDINESLIKLKLNDILDFYSNNYLPSVKELRDEYLLKHSVINKNRIHHDSEANNIVIEPDGYSMVKFKEGYAFGNPIKYAQSKDLKDNSLENMLVWDNAVNMRTVDSEVGNWVYSVGLGYYFIQPSDKSIADTIPYSVFCVEADRCFKVYSSFVGHQELFDVLVSPIDNESTKSKDFLVEIYTKDAFYSIRTTSVSPYSYQPENFKVEPRAIGILPLVEKHADSNRVGIIQIAHSLQDAEDYIISNQMDNIEDIVNTIYVFLNVNLGKDATEQGENFRKMVKNGALVLNSTNPAITPDVKTITTSLNHDSILKIHDTIRQIMYDICGVPLASSAVSSGGDTGQARSLGNGWQNAYNRLLTEINIMIEADRQLLTKKIKIIKADPDFRKVFVLESSQIEIKYNPNLSDNMLVKTQSYVNLVTNNVPPSIALAKTQMSNDPASEGNIIEEYAKAKAEQEAKSNKEVSGGDNMT